MTYDAIIFDFDGVLITGRQTPEGVYAKATREVLAAYGTRDPKAWDERLERPTDSTAFREGCEHWELPANEAWGYREAAATHVEHAWLERGDRAPFPDVDIIPELAEHYSIGIASNNRHALVGTCLDRFGWTESIDAYRGRYPTLEEYDHRKPKPRFVRAAIQRLGAENPLYVGDRETDVIAAERVGCDSVFLQRSRDAQPADRTPTYDVTSLRDLPERLATG